MPATMTQTTEPHIAEDATTPHVAHLGLPAALAAFQAEIPSVAKQREVTVEGDNGPEVFMYADLATITERTLPILGKHGLSFSALPTTRDGDGFILEYTLRHEGGGMIAGTFPLPDPTLFDGQDMSGAITRARRLALCAVTGVAPGGDTVDVPRSKPDAPVAEPTPTRDWLAEAALTVDKAAADALWAEARKGVTAGSVPKSMLDEIAAVWRKRQGEQAQPAETPAQSDDAEEAAA